MERRPGDGTGLGRCAPDQRRPGHPRRRPGVRVPVHRRRTTREGHHGGREQGPPAVQAPRIWSVFSKKRGLTRKPGPPVHDDLVERDFTADGPERAVADRHHRAPHRRGQALPLRGEGRLFRQDRRLLDGLTDEVLAGGRRRWRTRSAARRPAETVVHSDRGPSSGPTPSSRHSGTTGSQDRWAGSVRARTTPRWSRSSRCCKRTSWTVSGGPPGRSSGWPSRPGSSGPTTAGDGKDGWENSRPSNMKQSTGPRSAA